MTSARIEMLTPTEAAVVSCVTVRDVNRVIDEKILPKGLYKVSRDRTRWFNVDACAFISFYFKAANQLTSEERMRTIVAASARLHGEVAGVLEKEWTIRQEFLTIDLAPFLRSVHQRLAKLTAARALVVEDADILGSRFAIFCSWFVTSLICLAQRWSLSPTDSAVRAIRISISFTSPVCCWKCLAARLPQSCKCA